VPGFGESAFATNSHASDADRESAFFTDQAIYEFSSATKASGFFAGLRQVLANCARVEMGGGTSSGPDQPPIGGHKAIGTAINPIIRTAAGSADIYGTTQPVYVLDGSYVYAMASGVGRNQVAAAPSQISQAQSEILQGIPIMIGNVAALSKDAHAPLTSTDPTTAAPSPLTTSQAAGPSDVVQQFYAAINAQNYQLAWNLGGDNFGETYQDFVNGYQGTTSDDLRIVSVSGDVVTVTITADQASGVPRHFAGTYTVGGGVITAHSIHSS
jgi:hypothetical protein